MSLIETMTVCALAAILSCIALPGLRSQLHKSRRAEALVSMMQIQLGEERFRSSNTSYGTLVDIGAPASSPSGNYTLQLTAYGTSGYELLATAIGVQTGDTDCAYLKLSAVDLNLVYASGPGSDTANADDANRRCWNP